MIIFSNILLIQAQTLTKDVRNDFCRNAKVNFYYGSNSFRGWMVISAQRLGYQTPLEIEKAVLNICVDVKLQEEFFKSVDRLGGDRSFKEQQYIAIGMKPYNAKLINDYMMLKNHLQEQKNPPKNPVFEDDLVNESNVINKKQLLQSIYPKSILLNDSTVLRKEIFDVIGGGDKEIEFKTTIAKEYSYTDEKKDEDRIKIILYSTNEKGIVFFDILIMSDLGEKGYQSIENMSFLHRRLHLDKSKRNIDGFKTVKENGKTFFVINYTDENNKRKSDFYTIDLKAVKTLAKNEKVKNIENDNNEIVKLISDENLKKTFLPNKLNNSRQLFNVPNFKYRMINLLGEPNYNFIQNLCINDIEITNDSNYFTIKGYKGKKFNNENKDNYFIAIDPTTQVLFVGIRKDNKILLYGEEKVFPDEIYQWKTVEENIK